MTPSLPTSDRNFRLPLSVRPQRYQATVTIGLTKRTFEGEQTVSLTIAEPSAQLILHAAELELGAVTFAGAGAPVSPSSVSGSPESQTVTFRFDPPLPAGSGKLHLRWTGKFSTGLRGLYPAGPLAVTQFEAADARRLFPCFDEPLFKATWALTVKVAPGLTALSNGRVEADEPDGPLRRIRFAETELLSSYLVAIAVGPMESSPEQHAAGVPVRTWSVPGKVHLTAFGQEAACEALPRLQDYFGLPYAFGKVDQLAVPDFEAGAMENAGLITFREVALLLDRDTASLTTQKRIAEVITHELAHQWFGNWVTMVWWDDLWLNEAFATWMAFKIVDAWRPEWRLWLDFDQGKAAAFNLDALRSTHPVRGEVLNAEAAAEAFDLITYEKGGAVLRMIESFLGEQVFREGIRLYMRRHARANAVADDLWAALAESSKQPVVELANAWIRQGGFPVIKTSLEGKTAVLAQQRFYSEPGVHSEERWPVPMVLRFADDRGVHEQRVLLREPTARVELPAEGPVKWLVANAGATGFYRTDADTSLRQKLADNLQALAPAERISLLGDEWALLRSGQRDIGAYLDLVSRFGAEEDYAVLDELVARLGYIGYRLVSEADQPRYNAFLERLFGAQLAALGWDVRPGEGDPTRMRRAALVRILGVTARNPAALAEARQRVERVFREGPAALDANLYDSAVAMVARAGDEALFDELARRSEAEADPTFKRRYLMALAQFEAPALAQKAQALIFGQVPKQDFASFVHVLLGNRVAQAPFWKRMLGEWSKLIEHTGGAPMVVRRLIEAFGSMKERVQLDEARAFLAAHASDAPPQATAQTLERLAQDVELRERALEPVSRWLSSTLAQHG